jgi:hypothetical protein
MRVAIRLGAIVRLKLVYKCVMGLCGVMIPLVLHCVYHFVHPYLQNGLTIQKCYV